MAGGVRKIAGWLWVSLFYILVLVAGMALVAGGTVLATYGWGMLQNDSWHMIAGITLMVASIAVLVGGVILLFRIISIPAPRRPPDNANARTGEYAVYTDSGTFSGHGHHHGGGHDGSAGGSN